MICVLSWSDAVKIEKSSLVRVCGERERKSRGAVRGLVSGASRYSTNTYRLKGMDGRIGLTTST
jgi:hypothetical protein